MRTPESQLTAEQSLTGGHWNSLKKIPHIQTQRRSHSENTWITTDCWTVIDRETLELTKKDTPHPKTKEKPHWDSRRGTITIKSNPITAGWWLTNWRTLIPQKSTHWREGSEPHVRLPNLEVRQWEEEFLEDQTLKGSGIWLQDFDRTGGNRDSTLGGHTQSSVLIRTQGKEQWPHRRLNQTYLLVLEISCRGCGWLWLTVGTRTLAAEVLGSTPWHEPSQSLPFTPPKSLVGSSAGSSQAKRPTGREPSPTHQQTSGFKFYWALPRRATPSSTHHQSLPSGSLHKPLR